MFFPEEWNVPAWAIPVHNPQLMELIEENERSRCEFEKKYGPTVFEPIAFFLWEKSVLTCFNSFSNNHGSVENGFFGDQHPQFLAGIPFSTEP